MGVFHPDLVGIQVRVLQRLGSQHVLVVHGKDGMDEVSLGAATMVGELKDGEMREYEIHPEDFGLRMMANRSLQRADARRIEGEGDGSAGRQRRHGARHRGAQRRHGAVRGERGAIDQDGIERARAAIAGGAARRKLDEFVAVTQQLGGAA